MDGVDLAAGPVRRPLDDVAPVGRERHCDRAPDPPPAARHDRRLTFEEEGHGERLAGP